MSNIYPPNKCFTCKKNNVSAFNGTYCVEHIPKTTRPPIKPDIEQELPVACYNTDHHYKCKGKLESCSYEENK